MREKAFSLTQLQPGGAAADTGAGAGFMTEGLVQLGLKVIAIDQSAAMLQQMRSKFGNQPGIEYRQGAARVLREGGKLIVTGLDEHGFEFLRIEQEDRWLGFKRRDVRAGFEDAGLTDVGVDCVGADCCADSESVKVSAGVSIFVAWGTK